MVQFLLFGDSDELLATSEEGTEIRVVRIVCEHPAEVSATHMSLPMTVGPRMSDLSIRDHSTLLIKSSLSAIRFLRGGLWEGCKGNGWL